MSLFKDLTDDGLEKAKDSLGGGYLLDTGIYTGNIKAAYAGESSGGAMNVTVVVDIDGKDYTETLYVTNKEKQNFYMGGTDKNKKIPMMGFTVMEDICLVTTEEPLFKQETEERVLKLYNYEEKKDIPTKVQVLPELLGKTVTLAIIKFTENKKVYNEDTKEWDLTAETQDKNAIEKVFHTESGMTVVEIREEAEQPTFKENWENKNKGITRNRVKPVVGGGGGKAGAPKASAPSAAPKKSGLFGNKKS